MYALFTKTLVSGAAVVLLSMAVFAVGPSTATDGSSTRQMARGRSTLAGKSAKQETLRLREGTIISDQNGFFREDGDGATFVADTGIEFGALPNLNLERVVRLLKSVEEPNNVRWSVNGTVTEFSGRNYLLISRAVYKAASTPPPPSRIVE